MWNENREVILILCISKEIREENTPDVELRQEMRFRINIKF